MSLMGGGGHNSLNDENSESKTSQAFVSESNHSHCTNFSESELKNQHLTDSNFSESNPSESNISQSNFTQPHSTELNLSQSNISNSQIDYLIFLDPDDFWTNDCLEQCVNALFNPPLKLDSDLESNLNSDSDSNSILDSNLDSEISESNNLDNLADIVWFRFDSFYDGFTPQPILDRKGNDITLRHRFEEYEIFKPTSLSIKQWLILHHKTNRQHFAWVWGGIFKFSLLKSENIRFLNGLIYEDNLFGAQLFLSAQKLIILPQNLYVWRARLKSTMTQHEDKNKNFIKDLSPYIAKIYSCFKSKDVVKIKQLYCSSCFMIMLYELIRFLESDGVDCGADCRALKDRKGDIALDSEKLLDEQMIELVCRSIVRNYLGTARYIMSTNDDAFGVKNKLEIFQPYIKYGSFETRLAFNNPCIYRFIVSPIFSILRKSGAVRFVKRIIYAIRKLRD